MAFETEPGIALFVSLAKPGSIFRVVQGMHRSIEGRGTHLLVGLIEYL